MIVPRTTSRLLISSVDVELLFMVISTSLCFSLGTSLLVVELEDPDATLGVTLADVEESGSFPFIANLH